MIPEDLLERYRKINHETLLKEAINYIPIEQDLPPDLDRDLTTCLDFWEAQEAEDELRQQAAAKLTPEERVALGVDSRGQWTYEEW